MLSTKKIELSGWGGYPRVESQVVEPADLSQLHIQTADSIIMRGQGRSYGDAAISRSGLVVLSQQLGQMGQISDDGLLTVAAGATLDQILRIAVPNGWFPAVVPGTRHVSVGGCLAADVHGKNHHRVGSFADHVSHCELLLADDTRIECSANDNADLFWATAGGMGLTGVLTSITLQLIQTESAYMSVQYHQSANLDETIAMLSDKSLDDEYTVMWLDCAARGNKLGRSVLLRGHHARIGEVPAKLRDARDNSRRSYALNFDFPDWILNSYSISVFNELYFRSHGARNPFIQHYQDFFFPLDRIENWNRMYGRRGFIQYQCVFPLTDAARALQLTLEELQKSNYASFLSVLKLFGPGNKGPLSFPIEGYTLTLDLPLGDGALFAFLDQLDELVLRFGGRVYLAKDARMKADNFRKMYPALGEWESIKKRVDPSNRFQSDLSRRLRLGNNGN